MTRASHLFVALAACGSDTGPPDAACAPGTLYLNRTGATYARGRRDDASTNLSEIIDAPRDLPPWPHDDLDWRSLVDCIRAALAAATSSVVSPVVRLSERPAL